MSSLMNLQQTEVPSAVCSLSGINIGLRVAMIVLAERKRDVCRL